MVICDGRVKGSPGRCAWGYATIARRSSTAVHPLFYFRRPSENQLLRLATAQGDQKASALAVHVQATFGSEKRTFSNSAYGSSVSDRQSQDMSAMVISGTYQQPHSHDFASFPRPVCDGEAGAFLRRAFLAIDTATSRQTKAEPAATPFASSATF